MRVDLPGVLLLLLAVTPLAHAGNWSVVHEESRLGFTATQTDSEFSGRFEDFDADMTFHADDLAASAFDVTVDVTSVDTGSNERDSALAEKPWFWFEEFPKARFKTKRIVHKEGDRYEAVADLTIKSNTHEVTLPFSWKRQGDEARIEGRATAIMEGGLSMDRTRWEVGTGEWSDGDT
ncbi:MAG: YceI family protein, partial [Halofilum sp. (in: g-proteobacteria)]